SPLWICGQRKRVAHKPTVSATTADLNKTGNVLPMSPVRTVSHVPVCSHRVRGEGTSNPSELPLAPRSLLDQRAVRFAQRPEHIVAGHHVLHLFQVPLVRRLAGPADLDQVHVVHQTDGVPDLAV